jgi:threonine/homoserine/homoserine lactone efflux protein
VIAYSGAMMPGPMLVVVVTQSPRQGFRAGPLAVLGHGILELALLVALVVGLGGILERSGVRTGLALVGGAMLIWTAASMIGYVARGKAVVEWQSDAPGTGRLRTVLAGVVSSISNPYWTIWWATIGIGLLTKAYAAGIAGLVAFYVGHILGDLTWYSAISGLIAAGRRFMTAKIYAGMLLTAAVFLLGLAGWFIYSGVGGL